MKRRDFLKNTSLAAATSGLTLSFNSESQANQAQSSKQPIIVMIYLRGGQDQLNAVVPYTDSTYYKIRPTIAIPKEQVLRLDDQWGLHPALEPLKKFYEVGKVAPVINSGSPHPTRSHFDAQDFMEYAAPGYRTVRDGWLNRYLQATKNPRIKEPNTEFIRSLAMQERLPRSLRGKYPVVAVPPNLREMDEVLDVFEDFYSDGDPEKIKFTIEGLKKNNQGPGKSKKNNPAGPVAVDPILASGKFTIQYLRRLRQLLYGEQKPTYGSSRDIAIGGEGTFQEYPGGWFASRLQALARIIKADVGLQVAATDINGWDHHIGLGSLDGTLNRMLSFWAEGIAAFMEDLGPILNRTLILVSTEFGRVCAENGNDGSDHGHGGLTWLMGGKVKGGKVYGEWTGLEPSELNQSRDLKVTTDFRDIYAEVLRKHLNHEPDENFFPGYKPSKTGLGLFG